MDLAITNRCNLRCKYCSHFTSAGDVSQDLATEEWLRFFEELNRCAVMNLTLAGGEAFCREDLKELIEGIVRNRMRFNILSNGTMITDEMAAFLAATGRCDGVQVSIDGSIPTTHDAFRGKGNFLRAMAGIKILRKHGLHVPVRVTIHRQNVRDLEGVAGLLLEEVGLPGFSTNAASHMGLCRKNAEQVQLTVEERSLAMETLLRLTKKYNGRISATAGPLAEGKRWLEMQQARREGKGPIPDRGYLTGCGGPLSKMAVRADGVMVPCGQMPHMALGRINRDDLRRVWQNHPELERIRERHTIPLNNFEFCKGCDYINYCTGSCPALAYTLMGEENHPSPDTCLKRFLEEGGKLPEEERPEGLEERKPSSLEGNTPQTQCSSSAALLKAEGRSTSVSAPQAQRSSPLNQIYFYLTEGCNLRCRHCWIAPKHQGEGGTHPALDFELFRSIIEQAKPLGLSGVKLTGGEPLLHPQFPEILEVIRTEALGLTVETNGVLCTPEMAAKMAACENPFVSVSLDGADPETHEWVRGIPGCFDAALEGVRNLVEAGFRPQIIMAIMRRNVDQMEAVVRLAEGLGAGSVKFNIVQPTARGEKVHQAGEALRIEELVDLGRWVETTLSAATPLRLVYSHPMAFRPLGKMFGSNGDGCGLCGILGIVGVLANGAYAMCGIGESVPDLVYGHAATDRLEDIWNNTPVLLELREGLPQRFEGICGECLMKGICLGSCVAQNYYRSKNLWAPFWYCEQAYHQGLFPELRIRPKTFKKARVSK